MVRWKTALTGTTLVLLWSLGSLFAAEVGGTDAQKELQKLQGTWVMVSGEHDGKNLADEHVAQSKIVFEGNKGKLVAPNQTSETIVFEIAKIDPATNPKQMHFVRTSGPHAGKTIIGIYEFDGNDQYKFAFDPAGSVILKEFATKEKTGHIRNTWKRVQP